jgi:hypothetical protein
MNEQHNDETVLSLPAPAPLPPDVHDRLRHRVFAQLGAPERPRIGRVPLVVAAAVVLLAVGGSLLAQSLHGGGQHTLVGPATTEQGVPPAPPLDPAVAGRDLDRCWSAIVTAHRTAGVPNRATWHAVFGRSGPNGQEVIAVSAQGKRLFCETTPTSVTVSDPNANPAYAGGSRTGSLLITPDGAVAGVVDPGWRAMVFTAVSPAGASTLDPVDINHGMFIQFSIFSTGQGSRFTVRELDPGEPMEPDIPVGGESRAPSAGQPGTGESHVEVELPRPAAPLVSVQDRSVGPVDRSSPNGLLLGRCIAKSDAIVPDPQSWQPGALVRKSDGTALVARNSTGFAVCLETPARPGSAGGPTYSFVLMSGGSGPAGGSAKGVRYQTIAFGQPAAGPAEVLVLGTVHSAVATVRLVSPDRAPVDMTPVNGTFAFATTERVNSGPSGATLRFLDADGKLIYQGPVG